MGSKTGDIISGFKYHLGIHLALCHGPVDAVKKIIVGDRVAWSGTQSSGTISVSALELFGGEKREGGVEGDVDILMGDAAQGKSSYLQGLLGTDIPAFRGVFCLLFKQFYYGTNPYLKQIKIQATRTDIHSDGSAMWYLAKAKIGDDMNPAHIIYECLTDMQWGMKFDASAVISDSVFQGVADTLFTENFGLSYIWNNSEVIGKFIQSVLNTINGVLRQNLTTGLLELKLIRNDYDVNTLTVLDETNIIKLKSFQRSSWDETVNEVTVVYHDEATDQDRPTTVQDLGNVQIQGRVVPKTLQMPGITNETLAIQVALRETKSSATPLSSVSMICNRAAWALNNGDVFKLNWPKLGIVDVVYRISTISENDLKDGQIYIEALEDVFAAPESVYSVPQAPQWTDPRNTPADALYQKIVEGTYWDAVFNISAADRAQLGADYGFVQAIATRPTNDAFAYDVWTKIGAGSYEDTGAGTFAPTCTIDTALIVENTSTFNYSNGQAMSDVSTGLYAYIEDEIVKITAIDTNTASITVSRGILDTVPVAHAINSRIHFAEKRSGFDKTERTVSEVVDAKLLTQTPLGILDLASATAGQVTMNNRAQRPYAPGQFQLEGSYYPANGSGDLAITWAHRDRTLQTAYLVDQTEASIGPESNTSYTLKFYNGSNTTPVRTVTGQTGTSYTYLQTNRIADFGGAGPHTVRVRLYTVNDSLALDSWQFHEHTLTVNDI